MWGCLMKCSQERKAEEGLETSELLRQLLLPKGWSGISSCCLVGVHFSQQSA